MATLLFRLRNVPEDEAAEVRALLDANDINYYETSAGNWRISMPAIWLTDDRDLSRAKELLDEYQQQRYRQARQEFEALKLNGQHQTLWKNFLQNPFRVSAYLALVGLVLFLSIQVYLSL